MDRHKLIDSHFQLYPFINQSPSQKVNYLYGACSNPTNDVLVIVLSMIIGKGAWYRYRIIWSVCKHWINHSVPKLVWIKNWNSDQFWYRTHGRAQCTQLATLQNDSSEKPCVLSIALTRWILNYQNIKCYNEQVFI